MWSHRRNEYFPHINDHENRFRLSQRKLNRAPSTGNDSDTESDNGKEVGLGYAHAMSAEADANVDDSIVIPFETDLGHLVVVDIQGINDEIFYPERFLKRAIEQMYNFCAENSTFHWPLPWLDYNFLKGRCIPFEILQERQPIPETERLSDFPPCTWSEHRRAQLIHECEREVASNIDVFVRAGIDNEYVEMANQLDSQYQSECTHLPILWSVFNVRTTTTLPVNRSLFLNDNHDDFFEAMVALIQSRYLIDVALYDIYRHAVTLANKESHGNSFQKDQLLIPPLVVYAPSSEDVFVFSDLGGSVLSFCNKPDSLKMGRTVADALWAQCPWLSAQNSPTNHVKYNVHGLVSNEICERLNYSGTVMIPLRLEMVMHALVQDRTENISDVLTSMCHECLKFQNIESMYLARRWWAIARGELGNQTEAMDTYNRKRGLDPSTIERSAWDFKKRTILSNAYSCYGAVDTNQVLDLLDDFGPTDAITFSNNNIIRKSDILAMVEDPMSDGINAPVFNARADALNKAYSDKGGPRLYTQKELDYIMTNVKGREQRRKLTLRLFWGKPAFFILDYGVTANAMAKNEDAGSHVSLCKVHLTGPEPNNRVLVVEWLEGVFENIFKLCAVPILTYLSRYFGVEVRQVESSTQKTMLTKGEKSDCVPVALYAANERMRTLHESGNSRDWVPYNLSEAEAEEYVRELAYSLILVPVQRKRASTQMLERTYASKKYLK